jgi:hypothetical protein
LENIMAIWDILLPFGTICVHLVHFFCFGIMQRKKSGNPECDGEKENKGGDRKIAGKKQNKGGDRKKSGKKENKRRKVQFLLISWPSSFKGCSKPCYPSESLYYRFLQKKMESRGEKYEFGGIAGLPDGLLSNRESKFGKFLEGLAMEDVCIFCGHLVHFTVFCYILWIFGIPSSC